MARPRSRLVGRYTADISPVVKKWILRLLIPLGGHPGFVQPHGFSDDAIAQALDLGAWIDPQDREFDPKLIRTELRKMHQAAERQAPGAGKSGCLNGNIARLASLVDLSPVDQQILAFAVLINNDRALDDAADWLGQLSSVKVFHVLSLLLDLPEPEVRQALGGHGILTRAGLVTLSRNGASTLRGKLELLSDEFADHILSADTDPAHLLRGTVSPASPAQLALADFEHIGPSLAVLQPYLKRVLSSQRKGANIYVHGEPGTGKSQLAKVLAQDMGCELFEVASEDSDGDPVSGEKRLRAFRAAQSFFSQRKALIVFDEAEDVFNDGNSLFGAKSTAQLRKAWINRLLEDNPVPTLWLSNSISELDPAFIRRFDMIFALPVPPKRQRLRIIEEACADLLDAPGRVSMAESESLAPALVTRAASVARLIREDVGADAAASAMTLLINNTLQAQGHRALVRHDPKRLPDLYDPAFIHADADLAQVAVGLQHSKAGRLCLYGPPGTGKTAYARWLAEQLGVPLQVKRASDLMSKWVGDTERNIARAFKQAQDDGALLLIDEVDSFLQDRRNARQSWETGLVNEMLTQMESFAGVFVASTNLMTGLDQAARRRFDLKVKFDFLKPEQAQALFARYCSALNLPATAPEPLARLARLHKLTPGDFAAVARQSRFRPLACATALLAALEAECAVKEGGASGIGFLS